MKLLPENVREMSEGFSSIPENNKDALLFNTIFKITIYFADRKALMIFKVGKNALI